MVLYNFKKAFESMYSKAIRKRLGQQEIHKGFYRFFLKYVQTQQLRSQMLSNTIQIKREIIKEIIYHESILLPYSLRNGSMVMAKKIVFEIIADSDSTTLKT